MTVIATESTTDITTDLPVDAGPATSDGPAGASSVSTPVSSIQLEDGSEYLLVDPRDLIIGPNVRTEADLANGFAGFAKDIGRRGVKAPIRTERNANGALVVVEGQMRVLAALDEGKNQVRVLVEPDTAEDEKTREINRIVGQLSDNFHRTANTEADEIRATQQLVLEYGVSARSLERLRSIPRKRAQTLVSVARSTAAAQSITGGIADLTQAAVLVEFDGDENAVDALTECLQKDPARFAHMAQRLRDDREEARLRTEATARLAEQGVAVVEEPNTYGGPTRPLRELRATEKTQLGTRLTVKRHAKCPGHAAYLDYSSRRPVDERIEIVYVCTDVREHQHPLLWHGTVADSAGTGQRGGKMTEEQKAERRTVIRNGKAWDTATTVRQDWLREFAARRTPPKDAAVWMAQMWAQGSPALRTAMEQGHPLAMDLLGLAPKDGRSRFNRSLTHPIADAAATATPGRATMLSLVMLLAAIEESTDRRHTWDRPSREQIAYFTQLDAWGYALEEVEKLVLAHPTPAVATTPPDPALPDAAPGNGTDPSTEPPANAATDPPADLIDVDEAPVHEPMALVA